MDLRQRKLTKQEWITLEIPVQQNELNILKLIKAGYTPVGALFLVKLDFLNPSLSVPYKSIIHYE